MIICTAGGMTAATVRQLIEQREPRAAALAAPDWELYDLPTGHWAMFSLPDGVADLPHRIATTNPAT
jgi:hypothetical protein